MTAAALGLAGMTGGLFVTGALDPVLTRALTLVQADDTDRADDSDRADTGDAARMQRVADWMYYEDVPEWSSVRGVPQVTRVPQPEQPSRPAIAPPEHPHRFFFSGPPEMPRYYLEGPDDCMQPHNPSAIVRNYVVTATGGGSVSIRWYDMGDPDTQEYQVVAVPQYVNHFDYATPVPDPPRKYSTVKAADGCRQMRTTVSGLRAGAIYQFTLLGMNKSPLNGRQYSITRAVSEDITIR
ncbi:hypothetical protein KIH74_17325 [Kineosporia sp. J2-2]|uniref:Fibronectin type-III domain-containing protein n=1 Tax=Kineosporia corallincola TaxID=2835133 RepID=A0ABS5TM79_9ACTN|nr:hypothetical protein [Kineosporia corallincola]MBT0770709.1 hypothetical protein [Kineosporia corallincola]